MPIDHPVHPEPDHLHGGQADGRSGDADGGARARRRPIWRCVRAEWGLDRPLPVQYAAFVKNIVTGELGQSFNYEMPVSTLYFQRLPNSLELALAATLISFLIGIPAGIISAVRVNSAWDQCRQDHRAARTVRSGILARAGDDPGVFGVARMAADQRAGRLAEPDHAGGGAGLVFCRVAAAPDAVKHARGVAQRIHQAGAAEGPAGYAVIAIHAFKNALIPVLTLAGVNLVVMINAAVIIEVIFAWPGIGRLLYEGIFQRDFPLVQGVVMEAGIMIVLINLIVDILYAYIDPRIRLTKVGSHVDSPTSAARQPPTSPRSARSAELAAGWRGSWPVLPLAILVPFVFDRGVRQCHRALRPDRTDPRREDLRAAVLVAGRQLHMRCSAPISRAAMS